LSGSKRRSVPTVTRTVKLVKAIVERAWRERSPHVRTIYRDRSLLLTVNTHSASWSYEYKPLGRDDHGRRGSSRFLPLGNLSIVDLGEAQALKAQAKAVVARGEDPVRTAKLQVARRIEERKREKTVDELVADYCVWLDRQNRSPKHKADEKRYTRRAIELAEVGSLASPELRRSHVMRILDVAEGAALPRKLLGSLSRFCAWLIDRETITANPVSLIDPRRRPKPPKARSRVMTLPEVGAIWNAAAKTTPARGTRADKGAWCRLIRFALLMPARISEIGHMKRADIDLARAIWTQPGKATKNGDPHTLPLPPAALGLLREQMAGDASAGPSDPVWLGPSQGRPFNAWAGLLLRVRETSGVKDWTWHDIRRTVVSNLAEHGIAESIADSLLNHRQSATRSGVLGVYQRSNRHRERAEALTVRRQML
jgi:integrase